MKKTRSLLTLFLAIMILAGTVAFGGLTASAQGEPSGLGWGGTTGYWTPPDGDNSYYEVTLYVSGSVLGEYKVTEPFCYFGTEMSNYGTGDYFYGVRGVFDEGPAWISTEIISPVYHYEENSGCSHSNLTYIGFSYPTCTENGDKGHYECEDCGKWFWDEYASEEITDPEDVITEKLGHNWGEWVIIDEPTTEKEGKAQRVCANDSNHVETMTLSKLSDGESIEDIKLKLPELASEAKKPTENKTGATDATSATTVGATEAAKAAQRTKSEDGNNTLMIVLIIIGSAVLIALIVLILVIVLKKNKKEDDIPPRRRGQ